MTSRYSSTPKIASGRQYGTATAHNSVRRGVQQGRISVREHVLKEGERLDTIAGREYGNARLWWLIAAASGIGWGLQVPPGTQLLIPTDLRQLSGVV
jgi:nucleoid-associated protein YgaU